MINLQAAKQNDSINVFADESWFRSVFEAKNAVHDAEKHLKVLQHKCMPSNVYHLTLKDRSLPLVLQNVLCAHFIQIQVFSLGIMLKDCLHV